MMSSSASQPVPFAVLILAGALVLPACAQAVDTPALAASAEGVDTVRTATGDIIITAPRYVPQSGQSANKSNIPLIETPQSVSVISRDQIDLLNFIDAQQAVRYTAGVQGENYGPDLRYDFITVRGFTPKQYIDGLAAPISTTIYSVGVDLYAFDSFDVLKGPASVLYGNAPPGGIYNQTSRRAADAVSGEISAKYGEDDYKQIAGTLTGPISDTLSVRLTSLYRDRDAERDLVRARRFLVAPTATLKLGTATTVTALAYHQRDSVRGDTNGFLPVFGTLLPNPNGQIARSTNLGDPNNLARRRQTAIGYDVRHAFSNNVQFTSNAKWNRYNEQTPQGIYGGAGLLNTTTPSAAGYFRTVGRYNFTYREKVKSVATDNRLAVTFKTGSIAHKLLAGLDYRSVINDAAFGFFFNPAPIDLYAPVYTPVTAPAVLYPTTFNNQKTRQTGIYVQNQMAVGGFRLAVGGRQDWVSVNNRASRTSSKQNKFSWRAGGNYIFGNGLAPYVGYSRSFEPVLGTDSVTGQSFRPSTGSQWEAGVKYDARGLPDAIKLFSTASVFKITQSNIVSASPSITPVFGTQTGEVEVTGAELEIVARIKNQWSINAAYSYTDSSIIQSTTAAQIGQPLPTTPKHKISAFVDYTVQSGDIAGLGFGAGVRYHGKSAGSLPGAFNPVVYFGEASTLFDAIIHYDTPEWRLAINGSNVFDKVYVARCSGPAGCNYGAGRQVIGTVTRKF